MTLLQALEATKEGALTPLFPVLLLGVIGASPAWTGAVNSAFALTAVAAAPLLPMIIARGGYRAPIALGVSICGLLLLGLVLYPSAWTAFAVFLLSGFPFTVSWVAANTLLLLSTDEARRATVVGSVGSVYAATSLLSAVVPSVSAELVGVLPVLVVAAAIQIAAGLPARLPTRP